MKLKLFQSNRKKYNIIKSKVVDGDVMTHSYFCITVKSLCREATLDVIHFLAVIWKCVFWNQYVNMFMKIYMKFLPCLQLNVSVHFHKGFGSTSPTRCLKYWSYSSPTHPCVLSPEWVNNHTTLNNEILLYTVVCSLPRYYANQCHSFCDFH